MACDLEFNRRSFPVVRRKPCLADGRPLGPIFFGLVALGGSLILPPRFTPLLLALWSVPFAVLSIALLAGVEVPGFHPSGIVSGGIGFAIAAVVLLTAAVLTWRRRDRGC